uniref:Uncharacterized protein n=1 Tax=Aegilops tauschii subsp. strangulata TaxID=200361 RepID=A0A453P953_AEGTS
MIQAVAVVRIRAYLSAIQRLPLNGDVFLRSFTINSEANR